MPSPARPTRNLYKFTTITNGGRCIVPHGGIVIPAPGRCVALLMMALALFVSGARRAHVVDGLFEATRGTPTETAVQHVRRPVVVDQAKAGRNGGQGTPDVAPLAPTVVRPTFRLVLLISPVTAMGDVRHALRRRRWTIVGGHGRIGAG